MPPWNAGIGGPIPGPVAGAFPSISCKLIIGAFGLRITVGLILAIVVEVVGG
jgi:hypothetical protein